MELKINKEVIKKVEKKEDGWIVLSFREPHPIPEERPPDATGKEAI